MFHRLPSSRKVRSGDAALKEAVIRAHLGLEGLGQSLGASLLLAHLSPHSPDRIQFVPRLLPALMLTCVLWQG